MFWVVGNVVYFLISLHRTSTQIGFVHNSLARTNPTRTFIENFGWNDHTRCLGVSGVVADHISKRRHCRQVCGRLAWILSDYNCTLNTSLGPFHGTRSSTLCGITRWIRGARLHHGLPSSSGPIILCLLVSGHACCQLCWGNHWCRSYKPQWRM